MLFSKYIDRCGPEGAGYQSCLIERRKNNKFPPLLFFTPPQKYLALMLHLNEELKWLH